MPKIASGYYATDSLEILAGSGTAVVPIPEAVWLFGTALIGLIGFSKRRKTAWYSIGINFWTPPIVRGFLCLLIARPDRNFLLTIMQRVSLLGR